MLAHHRHGLHPAVAHQHEAQEQQQSRLRTCYHGGDRKEAWLLVLEGEE